LIQLVEYSFERVEVALEMALAVTIPAVGSREDAFGCEIVDEIQQLCRLRETPEQVVVFRMVVAELVDELPEVLTLDRLVLEDLR